MFHHNLKRGRFVGNNTSNILIIRYLENCFAETIARIIGSFQ